MVDELLVDGAEQPGSAFKLPVRMPVWCGASVLVVSVPGSVIDDGRSTAGQAGAAQAAQRRRGRRRWRIGLAALLVVVGAAALGEPVADELDVDELTRSLIAAVSIRGLGRVAQSVRPGLLPALGALAALHYLAAAVAVRAAGDLRGRLGETCLVQLAAAAANRLTPVGLGSAAVNVRYLSRRGRAVSEAIGAMAVLSLLGGLADLLSTLGVWLADRGGLTSDSAAGLLGRRLSRSVAGFAPSPVLRLVVLVVLLVLAGVLWQVSSRRRASSRRFAHAIRTALSAALAIRRRPWAGAILMAASASTTLIMGAAFLVSLSAITGNRGTAGATTLLLLFLVSSAAASSVPTPAGVGATEGALVAVLLLAHDSAAHALTSVLLFRLVTFWLRIRRLGVRVPPSAPRIRRSAD